MAKRYKYEAKSGDTVVCKISVYDDGHWEFDTWPEMMTKTDIDSYTESCQNALNRLQKHNLTNIEFKKL